MLFTGESTTLLAGSISRGIGRESGWCADGLMCTTLSHARRGGVPYVVCGDCVLEWIRVRPD